MMDVGWKQSVGAFARVVLNVVLVLATLSRMGPKKENLFSREKREIDRVNVIGLL